MVIPSAVRIVYKLFFPISAYPTPPKITVQNLSENLGDVDALSPSGGLVCLGDLSAPKQRTVRGEIDGMSISGHP